MNENGWKHNKRLSNETKKETITFIQTTQATTEKLPQQTEFPTNFMLFCMLNLQ